MTTAELHEILDDENRKLTPDANIIKLPRRSAKNGTQTRNDNQRLD